MADYEAGVHVDTGSGQEGIDLSMRQQPDLVIGEMKDHLAQKLS